MAHTCLRPKNVPGAGDRAALRPRATRAGAAPSHEDKDGDPWLARKTLDRFDWNHPHRSNIDRELFEQLHSSLDFIRRGENIPAARAGRRRQDSLIPRAASTRAGVHRPLLHAPCRPRGSPAPGVNPCHRQRLRRYTALTCWYLDELGMPTTAAPRISSFTSSAEHSPLRVVITTNLAYKQWGSVFHDASCLGALVDRFRCLPRHRHRRRILAQQATQAQPGRKPALDQ